MVRGCIGGEGRRIPQENFHYINSRLTQGRGVSAHQYLKFCSGNGVLPQKRKVLNDPVGEFYLVSPWVTAKSEVSHDQLVQIGPSQKDRVAWFFQTTLVKEFWTQ